MDTNNAWGFVLFVEDVSDLVAQAEARQDAKLKVGSSSLAEVVAAALA